MRVVLKNRSIGWNDPPYIKNNYKITLDPHVHFICSVGNTLVDFDLGNI